MGRLRHLSKMTVVRRVDLSIIGPTLIAIGIEGVMCSHVRFRGRGHSGDARRQLNIPSAMIILPDQGTLKMYLIVAIHAERDEILFGVITKRASSTDMVNL